MSRYFSEDPALCKARSEDPAWVAEQARKSQEAGDKFEQRRAEIGMPLIQKKRF